MTWFEALVLGLVQGLTEFLPVSSSGHLELGGMLFGLQDPDSYFTFNILVHGATFLSVVVVFRKDILDLIINLFRFQWNAETKFVLLLVASAVPVGIIGLLFESQIERIFEGRVMLVGFMLLITAALLYFTRLAPKSTKEVNLKRALIIGLAQTAAILPGISRSGATISTALYLGVERGRAIRFSFLMVLIPIFGANFLKLLKMSEEATTTSLDVTPLIIGAVAAFLSGLAACSWMLAIVRKGNIAWFAIYCLIVGLAAIIYSIV
ncbi:MAG: undecaprenyl-diphosphate phosphatase [Bacteroidales bacterium]